MENLGGHLITRANFFDAAILDAFLEFSSNLYSSACIRGSSAILVSILMFSSVRPTVEAFQTPNKNKSKLFWPPSWQPFFNFVQTGIAQPVNEVGMQMWCQLLHFHGSGVQHKNM